MKKITVLFFTAAFVFVMAGCQSTSKISGSADLKADYLKNIPHLANRIYITKHNMSADKMCDELKNILISRDHMTVIFDKERRVITTETKDLGYSTLQRMTFTIKEKGADSQVSIITEWKSGSKAKGFVFPVAAYALQSNWAPVQWEKNRLGIAFTESAAIANEIVNGIVSYGIDQSDLPWYNRKRNLQLELAVK